MKSIKLTIEDIFDVPTAVIYSPDGYKPVSSVSIDSRKVKKNSLFVAIEGENFDGHQFVSAAVQRGALAVVVNEKKLKSFDKLYVPVITVKNTTTALGDIAKIWRKKIRAKIIGITGSAGKTTTKEMLASILNEKYKVNKTAANNNNHIGVPLTILSTTTNDDILVAELGTNHFGEIAYTADILLPDYAVITNIGNSHLEFLKNKNGVYKEKSALFKTAALNGGTVFINNDDKILKRKSKEFKNTVTFGFESVSDVRGLITKYNDEGRAEVQIKYKNKKTNLLLPFPGEQNAKCFLAAAAVAFKLGLSNKDIINGSSKIKAVDKRLNVKKIKNCTLIDDTYNANPDSMRYAIELLAKIKGYNKKIAVLGDMLELGKEAAYLHKRLGQIIRKNKIDVVYTVGTLMKNLYNDLNGLKFEKKHFKNRKSLNDFLSVINLSNSAVLVKGSRGMHMEEFLLTIKTNLMK